MILFVVVLIFTTCIVYKLCDTVIELYRIENEKHE